jgi:hypothetical protein
MAIRGASGLDGRAYIGQNNDGLLGNKKTKYIDYL